MTRIALALLFTVLIAGCSDSPPPQDTSPPPAAPAPAPTATDTTRDQPAAPETESDPLRMAQELDQAEAAGATAVELDGESVDAGPVTPVRDQPVPNLVERFQQGRHYTTLTVAQPTSVGPDKVEVVEVFWYGCPHCYAMEPHLQAWLADGLPENVEFVRVHAALNRGWQIHARVFYTAEALGVLDQVHEDLFREIHVNRNPLNTQEQLVEFFAAHGVSESDFLDAFNSMGVETNLRRADAQVRRYRITGVPAVIVNGKYVTGADKAGGYDQMFEVIEFLINKESRRG
jgi:thiol:disulfide interchange protein DsbA